MIDDAGVPGHLLNGTAQRFPQSPGQQRHGLALRLRRGERGASGFGERTGNAPIEGMLIEYISSGALLTGLTPR